MIIRVRSRSQRETEAKPIEGLTPQSAFEKALEEAATIDKGEIRWDNTELLACLDIDNAKDPERLIVKLGIAPAIWWISRSGQGLHAIYAATEEFTACDIAWLAALPLIESREDCGIEVLARSAAPPFPPIWMEQGEPKFYVRTMASVVTDEERAKYLHDRGLHVGGRYPHTKCPKSPSTTKGTDPIIINEERLFCFHCQKGWDFGYLIHGKRMSLTESAAKHCVHWTHARYVIQHEFPSIAKREQAARSMYVALLKAYLPHDDPKIKKVFNPSLQFVRFRGYWADSETFKELQGHGHSLFQALPWLQHSVEVQQEELPEPDPEPEEKSKTVKSQRKPDKYETQIDPTRKGLVTSNGNLWGYTPIVPTRGIALWGIHNEYPETDCIRACVPTNLQRPPRYLPRDSRMVSEEAWKHLEVSFPEVDRRYLTLLIAGRAIAESGYGAVPILMVSGPSGAGKSVTVQLAAELIGDDYNTIQPTTQREKFETFFSSLASSGAGFIRLDEYVKYAKTDQQALDKMEHIYTIERQYDGNKMYVGTVRTQINSVVVVCSIEFPQAVLSNPQVSRRTAHVHLSSTVPNWRDTSGGIEGWRHRNDKNAQAADTLLSDIVDAFVTPGVYPDVRNVARMIGIEAPSAIEISDEHTSTISENVLALWRAVCDGKADKNGWIVCEKNDNPIGRAWRLVCDDPTESWLLYRHLKPYDLHKLCGFAKGTILDSRSQNGKLFLRFIITPVKRGKGKNTVNESIPLNIPTAEPEETTDEPLMVYDKPAEVMLIDFETRSFSDLKLDGGRKYAIDPTTEIFCCCAYAEDTYFLWHYVEECKDTVPGYCKPGDLPPDVASLINSDTVLMAHFANGFDRHVWKRFFGAHDNWVDTLEYARMNGHVRTKLDELGEDLYERGKDERGSTLLPLYSRPTRSGVFARFTPDILKALLVYNKRDVELMVNMIDDGHLSEVVPPDWERDLIACNYIMNDRGFKVDKQLAANLLRVEQVRNNIARKALGELTPLLTSHVKLKSYLNDHGYPVGDVQADTLRAILRGDYDGADGVAVEPELISVIEARLNTNSPTTHKCRRVLNDADENDRLHDTLAIYAAHTGRWGGRDFQPQNAKRITMDRDRLYSYLDSIRADPEYVLRNIELIDDINDLQDQSPRALIIADEGKHLIAIDYKQIEARVAAFLAGQTDMVQAFANDEPIYEQTAAMMLGIPVEQITKDQRQLGKVGRLAGNYQMGGVGYSRYCAKQGISLQKMGVDPNEFIKFYRKQIPDITMMWKLLHHGIFSVVNGDEKHMLIAGCEWYMQNGHLICRLPSGRCNIYRTALIEDVPPVFNPDITLPTVTCQGRGFRKSLYGGLEFENVVQSYSRDLLALSMIRAEAAGIPLVLCIHDEIICEVPEDVSTEKQTELAQIMLDLPDWASGLPIGLDIIPPGRRYGK